jgi:hypothetical protein
MACIDGKDEQALESLITEKVRLFYGMLTVNGSNDSFQGVHEKRRNFGQSFRSTV